MNTPAHSRMNLNRLFEDFNRWSLTRTFHDLFCSSDYYSEQSMELPFTEEHVRSVFREGVFEFRSYEKIPFFVVELKERHRIQALTGKKYQFSVARSVLRHTGYDAGLFLFFNPSEAAFRISYVFSVYADNRRTFSHYRRHSFYVARHIPNRTFLQQFSGCSFASADDIRRAFSLEPVTKEFYQQLEKWYYQALQQVRFPAIGDPSPTQKNLWLIRFITRMLFIWFLKVKGVVPEKLFDENYVRIILKDKLDPESSSYYLAILQNLFFATLNTAPENRKFRKDPTTGKFNEHYMKHHVFRHHALVEHPDIFSDLFGSIPFLNGGIFECLDYVKEEPDGSGKEIRMDGFSDVKSKQPHFPNRLLFGNNPEGPGLISLLNTFHFTIDENSPVDEDVALDPELLGHVFENLLATFNPETAQNARKLSGSFYTPRQVVDFMCRRALAHYLHTGIAGLTLQTALHLTSDADTLPEGITDARKMQVVQALLKCRVLDPACGSGAFPMGMLQRMVWILRKTDPDCKLLNREKEIHLRSVIKDFDKHADFINKVIQKTDDYKRKIHLIENCIFGTDIQPIAIQISKLRFFISLLAEEEVNPDAPNMGLRPLPNLDVKFLVANSLIALQNMSANLMQEQINKLRELMHEFFEARSYEEKNRIRRKFEALKKEMLDLMYGFNQAEVARQVEEFHPFYTDRVHNWFDPFLMFGINNGFDIVIGNPPYIQLQKNSGKLAELYKNRNYQTFTRTGDIYALFYEKGMELLKKDGLLCYITSNKWMRAGYGEKLRQYFTRYNPLLLIDLGPEVFENATVDTNILLLQKNNNQNQLTAVTLQKTGQSIEEQLSQNHVILSNLTKDAWFIGSSAEQRLKEKIERIGRPLKEWDVKIYYGIKTGLNEAFIITTDKRNEILANCKDEEERRRTETIIKPILRGRDIKRYYYDWAGLWVIFIPWHFPLHQDNSIQGASEKAENEFRKLYPAVYSHLLKYKELLLNRNKEETGIRYEWYALQRAAATYYAEFEKEKIFFKAVGRNLTFAKVEPGVMVTAPASFLTAKDLNYLLGVLCSRFTNYIVYQTSDKTGAGDIMLNVQSFERILVPLVTKDNIKIVQMIEKIVDKILESKKQDKFADTTEWEREIDRLVYRLYDLTPEEIQLIEKNIN